MNFIEEIKKSIYGPAFYQDLKNNSTKSSVGYFFKLSCLLALLSTFVFSIISIPVFIKATDQESIDSIIETFPKELTLTIQAGHLSTNVPEPYVIKLPDIFGSKFITATSSKEMSELEKSPIGNPAITLNQKNASNTVENLVVIATQADPNISAIDQILTTYKSHILVTATDIISRDSNGKITVQSLSNFPNTSINQDKFREFANKIRPLLKFIVPIGIPFIFLAFLIYFNLNLLFAFLLAIFVQLLGKIFKWGLTYRQSYAATLHSMTLGILIVFGMNLITSFVPLALFLPPFVFSIITLLIVYINLRESTVPTKVEGAI